MRADPRVADHSQSFTTQMVGESNNDPGVVLLKPAGKHAAANAIFPEGRVTVDGGVDNSVGNAIIPEPLEDESHHKPTSAQQAKVAEAEDKPPMEETETETQDRNRIERMFHNLDQLEETLSR